MRSSDWSSDVCSSDLGLERRHHRRDQRRPQIPALRVELFQTLCRRQTGARPLAPELEPVVPQCRAGDDRGQSEEHTSELQSLMRISYAVFCLNKKTKKKRLHYITKTMYISSHQYT